MPARPLVYRQVRMLAEAALGVDPSTFWFSTANMNGPLQVQGSSPPPDGVVVPTANTPRVVPLTSVLLEPFGLPDGEGVNAVALYADAAFWSDSAVQKFVLPYYASAMGYEAAERLPQLQSAWSGQVPGVDVYALLHVTAAPPQASGPPVPVEPLWVVFVSGPDPANPTAGPRTAQARPLADFLATYQPPPAPALPLPELQPYDQPATNGQALPGYGALRAMAEWSASVDTAEFTYFPWNPAAGEFGPPQGTPPTDPATIVIPVRNPNVNTRPTMLRTATLSISGQPPLNMASAMSYYRDVQPPLQRYYLPDAFFWSTAAIEQFMLPYYASLDGFSGLADLQAIQTAWTTSVSGTGGPAGAPTLVGTEPGTLLGLVHIPRSIWVTDETAAAQETFVAHVGPDGAPTVSALRDFIAGPGA